MKKNILVLEDDRNTRESITYVLSAEGYNVMESPSVPEAITLVRTKTVDLALVDIKMPIVDGYKFCEFLRRTDKYSNIPIIVLTAEEKRYGREAANFLGLEAFIEKPFDPVKVVRTVREVFQKSGQI